MTVVYIIIAIIIFGLLIAIHELGHFTAAKACGVRVSEFAIGMGPAIFKRQKGETLYALRALPIGGYCAMDEDEGESEDPRAFVNKPWWKRLIILVSGAGANFLAGVLVLMFIVPGSYLSEAPVITGIYDNSPYQGEEGIMVGDEFYKIDGKRVYNSSDVNLLLSRGSSEFRDLELIRDGERVVLEDFRFVPVEYEIDGETQMLYGFTRGVSQTGLGAAVKYSWYGALDFVRMVWMGLGDLVTGAVGLSDMSGPVGIVNLISDVGTSAETGSDAAFGILYLAAFIAVNLAVMNMLPIPALDGGRVFFLLINAFIEKILRKKLNPKYEAYIHTAGMVLLLGLMAVVMFSDIYKLFV